MHCTVPISTKRRFGASLGNDGQHVVEHRVAAVLPTDVMTLLIV